MWENLEVGQCGRFLNTCIPGFGVDAKFLGYSIHCSGRPGSPYISLDNDRTTKRERLTK